MPKQRSLRARILLAMLPFVLWALTFSFTTHAQTAQEFQEKFLHGDYDAVIQTATQKLDEIGSGTEWRILLIQTLLTTGRYTEAFTNAQAGVSDYPGNIRLRLLAREAALYQNDYTNATQQLAELKYLIQIRNPTYPSADNLVAVGQALLLLGVEPRIVLENCFRRAENMDPPSRDAFLAGGELALEKHDFALAAEIFQNGLKKFPDDPDMSAGLAQAFEPSNPEEMLKNIEAALTVNPHHIETLLLSADHAVDAEQYDEAAKQLDLILKVNPRQPEALAYRAVIAHFKNDSPAEKKFRDAALEFYSENPEVDHLIGTKLSQHYRFVEGAAEQKRALQFDPDYLPARRQLAEDLLRLGQNDEGWKLAEAVHKDDAYDITAYNLSTLHERMEKFATLTNGDFIVHMAPLEAKFYGDRVLTLLSREKAIMEPKYGIRLAHPTVVEIFPEQKDFAVRTFGMPGNPGYLGVCFGSVITANSPASQMPNPENWEDVLWHEFVHVITLTATKNKMPRWLSEGISVYEERQANPKWGERMNLEYRDLILNNELTPLGQLSGAFLHQKNILFAYYESSLVVEFIVQRFGFDTVKKVLTDLGNGVEINKAIAAHTLPLDELEKQFDVFARDLAKNLAPGVDLLKPPEVAGVSKTMWETAHANNYFVRLQKAQDLLVDKKWAEAKPILESLAESYHGEKRRENPLWMLAVVERNLGDTNAEFAALQKIADQENDFADALGRLIELSLAKKDWPLVNRYAEDFLAINPLITLPYRALAEAGIATQKNDQAIVAYRKLLLLDPPDPVEAHYQLARLLHSRGDADAEAKRHVLQALEDAPRFREAQKLLLQLAENSRGNQTNAPAVQLKNNP